MRQEQDRDDNASQQIPKYKLQKTQVPVKGERRGAHDGESTGFGRDNGKADGPPGGVTPTEEVVAKCALVGAEAGPEPGNGNQVHQDDREVQISYGHEPFSIPLI